MGVTQLQIAKRVGIHVSSVCKILNRAPGQVFHKKTIREVMKVARELGYEFDRIKFRHERRHPRKQVSLPVDLSLYGPDGALLQQGTAQIRDLSLSGAQLRGILLPQQVIPIGPHEIGLRVLTGILQGIELRCRTVRFLPGDLGYDLGVEFLNLQQAQRKLLRKIV